ncbi:MAG: glycosyltransferase family 4 protein [Candidatus Helarchaeota archaeon]
MRIFQFTPTFFPAMGGIETYIDNLCTKLTSKGEQLYVITRYFPKINDINRKFNYKVIRLKELNLVEKYGYKNIRHFYRPLYFYIPTKKLISTFRPDILHFHSRFYFSQARLFKIPTMFTSHTPYFWYSKKILARKIFLNSFDVILCLTKKLQHMVEKVSQSKAIYLPHGIDTNRFSPNLNGTRIREIHSIPEDYKIVLCLGRMVKYKGYHVMLKSMSKILDKFKKLKLIIVGSGPLLEQLKLMAMKYNIQKNVIFTGRVDDNLIPLYYSSCDIFVHPPLGAEYSPRVIFEALASGKPIISTFSGGVVEIIKNYKNGVLVRPNDPNELASAVINLLNDQELAKSLANNALKSALNEYSWDIILDKYINIIKSLI